MLRPLLGLILVVLLAILGGYFIFTQSSELPIITMPPKPDPDKDLTFVPTSQEIAQTQPNSTNQNSVKDTQSTPQHVEVLCTGAQEADFSCYEAHYENLVATKGIAAAFSDLEARYNVSGYVKAQCHPIAHVIGRAAANQFATVGEAYKDGNSFCWSGYYHGVLETFIANIGRDNLPTQMDKVCEKVNGKERYSFDYYNCVHGLGHGVMAATNDQLFEALDLCDNLTGNWEQISCASGVYMENIIIDGLNHKTEYLRPSEPLYPCNESSEKYRDTCYLMQTSYMLKINGGDFKKTFEWCREAGVSHQASCWQSLGRDASGRSSSNIESTRANCLLGENFNEQSNCVIGAVKDFISYFHSDVEAKEFCRSFTDPNLVSVCESTAKSYYTLL